MKVNEVVKRLLTGDYYYPGEYDIDWTYDGSCYSFPVGIMNIEYDPKCKLLAARFGDFYVKSIKYNNDESMIDILTCTGVTYGVLENVAGHEDLFSNVYGYYVSMNLVQSDEYVKVFRTRLANGLYLYRCECSVANIIDYSIRNSHGIIGKDGVIALARQNSIPFDLVSNYVRK